MQPVQAGGVTGLFLLGRFTCRVRRFFITLELRNNTMRTSRIAVIAAVIAGHSVVAECGELFVSSRAFGGGVATSEGSLSGPGRMNVVSVAGLGARANAVGRGFATPGSFLNIRSVAMADQCGVADSLALGNALGGSNVTSESIAATRGGYSKSTSEGYGHGNSDVRSYSRANSLHGRAVSHSVGYGQGRSGGRTRICADSLAEGYYGGSGISRVNATGQSTRGGLSEVTGIGRSIGRYGRHSSVGVHASGVADCYGISRSIGEAFDIE